MCSHLIPGILWGQAEDWWQYHALSETASSLLSSIKAVIMNIVTIGHCVMHDQCRVQSVCMVCTQLFNFEDLSESLSTRKLMLNYSSWCLSGGRSAHWRMLAVHFTCSSFYPLSAGMSIASFSCRLLVTRTRALGGTSLERWICPILVDPSHPSTADAWFEAWYWLKCSRYESLGMRLECMTHVPSRLSQHMHLMRPSIG